MNGSNPYTDRRYGIPLSATRGFLNAYMQHQKMQFDAMQLKSMIDYRKSIMALQETEVGQRERQIDISERRAKTYEDYIDVMKHRETRLGQPKPTDPYEAYGEMQDLVKAGMPPELAMRGLATKGVLSAFSPYRAEYLFPEEQPEYTGTLGRIIKQHPELERPFLEKAAGVEEPTKKEEVDELFADIQKTFLTRTSPEQKQKIAERKFLGEEKQPFTQGRIQQTLGELESGGAVSIFGTVMPFISGKDAINHAQRKLGPNWKEMAPEAIEIIERKWPEALKASPEADLLDALIDEFAGDEAAIRKAARERGITIPK